MKKIIAVLLVMTLFVGCVPSESPVQDEPEENLVINEPSEEPVEETVDEEGVEAAELDFVFPIIMKSEEGYTLKVDDQPVIDTFYDKMEYVADSHFIKAYSEGDVYLLNMKNNELTGPLAEENIDSLIQEVVFDNSIISYWDTETYEYGYIIDGEKSEKTFDYTSPFKDGYSVIAEGDTFKVIDEAFNVLFTHDVKIINYGNGYFGKVVDFATYDDFYNLVDLVDVDGNLVYDKVFEVDVINDNLILVADHKKGWMIDNEGYELGSELFSEEYSQAMVVAGYIVLFDTPNDYSSFKVVTDRGEVIYKSPEEEITVASFGDGIKVENKLIKSSRFIKSSVPVIKQEGSGDLFKAVNERIEEDYMLTDDRIPTDVWDTQEMSYDARRVGASIMEFDMFYYWYGFGAAHPNYGMHTEHIDLVTGQMYELKDLLKSESSYERLTEVVQEKALEMEDMFFDISEVTVYEDISFQLTDEGIIFYYDPYEVGPYAAGIPEIFVPFEDIMDEINMESPFYQAFKPTA